MRLVIARCSVDYVGRLTAHLPSGVRLLLVKADGSVSIHADDRAYKPLNWMSPPCYVAEADGVWRVTNKAGEELVVTIEEVLHDSSHELGVDPGLQKDGVEAHLQELLADRCEVLGEGWTLVRREYPTDIGRSTCSAETRAARRSPSRSSARARSTASSSSRAISTGSTAIRCWLRCEGCSRRSSSRRRLVCWPLIAASTAACSTTTP